MLEIVTFLKDLLPWSALTRDELEALAGALEIQYWPAGSGPSPAPEDLAFLLVRKGRLRFQAQEDSPAARAFGLLAPGDSLNLFLPGPWATGPGVFQADEDSLVYLLRQGRLEGLGLEGSLAQLWAGLRTSPEEAAPPAPWVDGVEPVPSPRWRLLGPEATVAEALARWREDGLEALVLGGGQGEPLALVTADELARWAAKDQLPVEAPLAAIASPLPRATFQEGPLQLALRLAQSGARFGGRREQDGSLALLSREALLALCPFELQLPLLALGSPEARRSPGLLGLLRRAARTRPLEANELASALHDALIREALQGQLRRAGQAPADFALVALGGQGRGWALPSWRQEHVLVHADCPGDQGWFLELGRGVTALLAQAGCGAEGGGFLASAPLWCKPVSVWRRYVQGWEEQSPGAPWSSLRDLAFPRRVVGTLPLEASGLAGFGRSAKARARRRQALLDAAWPIRVRPDGLGVEDGSGVLRLEIGSELLPLLAEAEALGACPSAEASAALDWTRRTLTALVCRQDRGACTQDWLDPKDFTDLERRDLQEALLWLGQLRDSLEGRPS